MLVVAAAARVNDAGDEIFARGSPGQSMMAVLRGAVKISSPSCALLWNPRSRRLPLPSASKQISAAAPEFGLMKFVLWRKMLHIQKRALLLSSP